MKLKTVKCKNCGKRNSKRNSNGKFCNDECKKTFDAIATQNARVKKFLYVASKANTI